MLKHFRILLSVFVIACTFFSNGCGGEQEAAAPESFSFVVYPGARYLGQLTEQTKRAHTFLNPGKEPPQTAIYDSDASVEQVAEYYAKAYGYKGVAPEASSNATGRKPQAAYRTGDLAADAKAIEELLRKMNMPTDTSKAQGSYKAAEIAPRTNRPRVTIVRPYFDVTTSQVVDRTLILMSRDA